MTISFLADEHVNRVVVLELRANGYDVTWVDGGYEPGTPDRTHLERSVAEERVILSNDADFARLHDEYDHGGIILYADQHIPVTRFVAAVKRIERVVPRDHLFGSLIWLDEWAE